MKSRYNENTSIDLSKERFLFKRSSGGPLIVLNAFPNTYEVAMASLGYQSIFRLYASNESTHTFRYFTNFHEIHPKEFHLMTFSISWELDFFNLLEIFKQLNIPFKTSQRTSEHPLILGGGPVLTANPEPWADFFDLIAIGDAENNTDMIIEQSLSYFASEASSKRNLNIFTEIPGIYVPQLHNKVERQKSTAKQMQMSSVIAPDSAWQDTGLLEVARSCPELCRFCLASYASLPFRTPDLNSDLIPKVDKLLEQTNNLGLLGASVTQHPEFIDLLHYLSEHPKQPKLQVASVRASTVTQEMCELLVKCGVKNLTIAIESGSERLRNIINKKLPEEYIFSAARFAAKAGIRSLKLYGMVGLPHETDEDIELTIELLGKLKKQSPKLKITWGCSIFTPKAQTPFQDYGIDKNAEHKVKTLTKALKPLGIEVRAESFKWAQVQALISRGDRSTNDILLRAFQSGDTGFNIYRKLARPEDYKHCVFENWQQENYPWDIITTDKQKAMLIEHKQEALNLA